MANAAAAGGQRLRSTPRQRRLRSSTLPTGEVASLPCPLLLSTAAGELSLPRPSYAACTRARPPFLLAKARHEGPQAADPSGVPLAARIRLVFFSCESSSSKMSDTQPVAAGEVAARLPILIRFEESLEEDRRLVGPVILSGPIILVLSNVSSWILFSQGQNKRLSLLVIEASRIATIKLTHFCFMDFLFLPRSEAGIGVSFPNSSRIRP